MAGDQLAFRLEQVTLGEDQDGETVTSCVVAAVDPSPSSKFKSLARLSPAQKRALELLANALAKGGEIPPPNDHIPPNTPGVTESTWR